MGKSVAASLCALHWYSPGIAWDWEGLSIKMILHTFPSKGPVLLKLSQEKVTFPRIPWEGLLCLNYSGKNLQNEKYLRAARLVPKLIKLKNFL